jgi:hypothetical protein
VSTRASSLSRDSRSAFRAARFRSCVRGILASARSLILLAFVDFSALVREQCAPGLMPKFSSASRFFNSPRAVPLNYFAVFVFSERTSQDVIRCDLLYVFM